MTPEQEAQQAQIQRHDMESIPHGMEFYYEMRPADDGEWVKWDDHKEIVDSQAQKIAEQAKEIEILQRIKRAAISAEYYQGTEGTAQELEDALKMTTDQTTDSKEVV